jgi:hypothetical protein
MKPWEADHFAIRQEMKQKNIECIKATLNFFHGKRNLGHLGHFIHLYPGQVCFNKFVECFPFDKILSL